MTNLEWLQKTGMITINCAFNKECEEIGLNIVINLRNKDYESFDEKGFGWLLEEHKEPIKLTKFEYDLLMSYINKGYFFRNYSELKEMRYKGYFKGISDTSMKIQYILNNCEVIK